MLVGIVSDLHPLLWVNASGGIVDQGSPHARALNVSVNVFAALVAHSLIAFWTHSKNGPGNCDLGNVIFHNAFVILHAVNFRTVVESLVKVAVNLYLSFHRDN